MRRGLGGLAMAAIALSAAVPADAAVLKVGPTRSYRVPSAAAAQVQDGDVVEIDAGVYEGDVAVWSKNNLILRGVGGRPHLKAGGASAQGKGTWVVAGRNTTVEHVEFSGARAAHQNGAGIRLDGVGLTVRHCFFHDNENGILGGGADGEVVIEYSEFAHNGHGDGQSHNIYINDVKRFTLLGSYSHHARIGHNVKSRAHENHILYNRIMDEATGTASYAIDLPGGGLAYVIGNLIQQGPLTDNATIVSYGAEGLRNPRHELYFVNNTVVNERPQGGRFVFAAAGVRVVRLVNNLFIGRGTVLAGPGEKINNVVADPSALVNVASYDYRLVRGAPGIDGGIDPGSANGVSLWPAAHYVHPVANEPRPVVGRLDVGAYEFVLPRR